MHTNGNSSSIRIHQLQPLQQTHWEERENGNEEKENK